MKIQESAENYLETLLLLQRRLGNVRAIDIATELGFSKPSVSVAMKQLCENGYVQREDGFLSLTEQGYAVAVSVYERHRLMTDYLISIGVPPEIAAQDACKLEHSLSPQSYEALRSHYDHQHVRRDDI